MRTAKTGKQKRLEASDKSRNKRKHNMLEAKRKEFQERKNNQCQMLQREQGELIRFLSQISQNVKLKEF